MIRLILCIAILATAPSFAQVTAVTANATTGALQAPVSLWEANASQIAAALDLASVATTGNYSDLSGRPSLGTVSAINLNTQPSYVLVGNGTWKSAGDLSVNYANTSGSAASANNAISCSGGSNYSSELRDGGTGTTVLKRQGGVYSGDQAGLWAWITGNATFGTLAGNNTWSGSNTFNGTVSLNGQMTLAEDAMVAFGETGTGFRYNPELTGQLELVFPGGVAAFYQTGAPLRPFFYFPGTIQADYLVGAIDGVTINAEGLTGTIPSPVLWRSLPSPLQDMIDNAEFAGANGIAYVDGGFNIGMEPTPPGARYFMTGYVEDGGDSPNLLNAAYLSIVQVSADTHPSASASLDFPSIAAAGVQSLTITVSGAATTNTPSVHLGWSAALPAGVVVAQAYVSAFNTVTITLANLTAAPIDPPAVTCRASITQY